MFFFTQICERIDLQRHSPFGDNKRPCVAPHRSQKKLQGLTSPSEPQQIVWCEHRIRTGSGEPHRLGRFLPSPMIRFPSKFQESYGFSPFLILFFMPHKPEKFQQMPVCSYKKDVENP